MPHGLASYHGQLLRQHGTSMCFVFLRQAVVEPLSLAQATFHSLVNMQSARNKKNEEDLRIDYLKNIHGLILYIIDTLYL